MIKYRTATLADHNELDNLDLVSAGEELVAYGRNKKDLFDVEEYSRRNGSFWVAEDDNKIVGMVGVRSTEDGKMKVKALRVHPDYRRQGIAKKLMEIMEDYCREKGISELILVVNKRSVPAIALYELLGYRKYEEKQFESGSTVFYFKKELLQE